MRTKLRENIVITSFIVLTIFLFTISFVNGLTQISGCGTYTTDNEFYNVSNFTTTTQNCIVLTSRTNVTLDCGGRTINGGGATHRFISLTTDNGLTLQNCVFSDLNRILSGTSSVQSNINVVNVTSTNTGIASDSTNGLYNLANVGNGVINFKNVQATTSLAGKSLNVVSTNTILDNYYSNGFSVSDTLTPTYNLTLIHNKLLSGYTFNNDKTIISDSNITNSQFSGGNDVTVSLSNITYSSFNQLNNDFINSIFFDTSFYGNMYFNNCSNELDNFGNATIYGFGGTIDKSGNNNSGYFPIPYNRLLTVFDCNTTIPSEQTIISINPQYTCDSNHKFVFTGTYANETSYYNKTTGLFSNGTSDSQLKYYFMEYNFNYVPPMNEINLTTCANITNINYTIINIKNNINYNVNQVCLNLTNVSNTIINGNYYNLNSTVSINSPSTAIQFNDLINDTTGFNNVTIQNINFTGGVSRPIYFDTYQPNNNINLINLTWNATGIVSSTNFINGATTKGLILYNFNVDNVWAQAFNKSSVAIQGFLACTPFGFLNSQIINLTYNNINISFTNPLPCASTITNINDNYIINNSEIITTGTNFVIATGFDNTIIENSIIRYLPTTTSQLQSTNGIIILVNTNSVNKNLRLYNNILNNVSLNYNNPQQLAFNICLENNNFNNDLFNSSGGVKLSWAQFFHVNRTCSINNIGWLPPSYYVDNFYTYIGNNVSFLKYGASGYPEFAYNFQFYNGTLGGYEFNQSGLFFNENLTFYTNNNYTRAGVCIESWYAILGDCINNLQFLTYVDVNMCGTNYSLPSNDNTYLNCTSTGGGTPINDNVQIFINVAVFLLIVVIVASVIFALYDNIKRRK